MAAVTLQGCRGVRPPQRELRLCMVEASGDPIRLGVAIGATFTEMALVLVILDVTADAGAGCFAVDQTLMAGLAVGLDVATEQGECRAVMVEAAHLAPAALAVAAAAFRAQSGLVLVVLSVATDAGRVELVPIQVARVNRPGSSRHLRASN